MAPLRVGLVGCGHNGLAHAQCYAADPGTDLIGVCDLNDVRRQEAAQKFGVTGYSRVDDLLAADLDLLLVCTGDPFHVEPFIAGCEAGCHVFVEKPMADTIDGLERMCAAAAANPRGKTLVGQVLRFNPFYQEVHRLATAGELGELFYLEADYIHNLFVQAADERFNPAIGMNWYTAREQPAIGGGVHAFDLLRWFCGSEVVEVSGYANRIAFPRMQQPDCQVFLARFETGAIAKVASAYGPIGPRPPVNHLSVYGTKGTVRGTDLWRGEGHEAEHRTLENLTISGHPYEPEKDELLAAIEEDRPTICDAFDGANSTAVCIRGAEAAEVGKALGVARFERPG